MTYRKPTSCGTQAQPTFFVQMRDVDRTSTDQWDNTYLSVSDGDEWTWISGEVSKSRALLVTIEPGTNYVREVQNGRYLNIDFFNDFQLLYFNTKSYIDAREYHYVVCSIVKVGNERELKCNAPTAAWDIHIWQTCPEYVEYYDTPLVFGAEFSKTTPDCFEKKFYAIDACA